MCRLSFELECMPYAHLVSGKFHRPGVVRMFLKFKSLYAEITSWADFKWRPLISYYHAHYRKLYQYVSKFCNFCIRTFKLGLSVDNPRKVIQDVEMYNKYRDDHNLYNKLILYSRDVEDFFTNVQRSEFIEALIYCVKRLKGMNVHNNYFCISRNVTKTLPQGIRSVNGTYLGWRQVIPTSSNSMCVSTRKRRNYTSIKFKDIMKIVRYEFKYNMIIALGHTYTQREGFGMGLPYAPGGSNLVVCLKELRK